MLTLSRWERLLLDDALDVVGRFTVVHHGLGVDTDGRGLVGAIFVPQHQLQVDVLAVQHLGVLMEKTKMSV